MTSLDPACRDGDIMLLFCPTGQAIFGFSEMACSDDELRRNDDCSNLVAL